MNKIKKNYLHMKQSSMSKTELAEVIGKKLKEETFGKVFIRGTDYKGDYYKGLLRDEEVEIKVIPEEFKIRACFQGNRKLAKKEHRRKKIKLNSEL